MARQAARRIKGRVLVRRPLHEALDHQRLYDCDPNLPQPAYSMHAAVRYTGFLQPAACHLHNKSLNGTEKLHPDVHSMNHGHINSCQQIMMACLGRICLKPDVVANGIGQLWVKRQQQIQHSIHKE